jgi:hypothetical protein
MRAFSENLVDGGFLLSFFSRFKGGLEDVQSASDAALLIGGRSQLQQGGQQQQPAAAAANQLNKPLLFLIVIDTKGSRLILNHFHQYEEDQKVIKWYIYSARIITILINQSH